ncbi:MAG: carbohydrate-binding domain-containing protein, partial [Phycisphaerae bacterium]|nr:carbohydrate-binding domain-containing protein [Phycisphaerae bacterium]
MARIHRTRPIRLMEPLETRRLLASAVLLPGGLLRVVGQDHVDDVVTVGLSSSGDRIEVTANGSAPQTFSTARVRTVDFYGKGGDDLLVVLEQNGTLPAKLRFFGGDGADLLKGGAEDNLAFGGSGNDTILLGGGANVAFGGSGDDTIIGSAGRDRISGNSGVDTIDLLGGRRVSQAASADTGPGSSTSVGPSASAGRAALPLGVGGDIESIRGRKIYIIFDGTNNATVVNPYEGLDLAINATGGAVQVTNTVGLANLEYHLVGTSSSGSLNVSSTTPAVFVMRNLNLTNPSGPAIQVTGGQTHRFISEAGTVNSLMDGSASTRNGTLQTDGRIVFAGTGSLTLRGVRRHGVFTSSVIEVQSSSITVTSAASDGFRSEGFQLTGGSVTVAASGSDGVDAGDGPVVISGGALNVTSTAADVRALKTGNSTITITGGTFNLNVSGNASKAVSARGNISVFSGTFEITLSGSVVLSASGSGFNPSFCSGFKSDGQIVINGGTFTIAATSTASGAKGFSADSDLVINNGSFNITTAGAGGNYTNPQGVADSYSTSAFSTDTNLNVLGGTFTLNNSGSDGKGFSADGNIQVSGGTIHITNSGASGKGFKADGSISFAGGNTTVNLSGPTVLVPTGSGVDPAHPAGVRAWGNISVSAGSLTIVGTATASGARGLSAQGAIQVTGGSISVNVAGNGANYTNSSGVADSYSAAAFSSDSAITVTGGSITTTSSGTGGKGLKSDGTISIGSASGNPTLNITTNGARFATTGTDFNHPKAILADGAISIVNGNIAVTSTDDGIHSHTSITISGGTINVNAVSPTQGVGEGIESPIINFTGGVTHVNASNDGINSTYGLVT